MALTKNNVNTFYENLKVNFKRIERSSCMSCCVSRHEPLKVQNSDGKSARIFQRNPDQAMAHTRCCKQWFVQRFQFSFLGLMNNEIINPSPTNMSTIFQICLPNAIFIKG